MGRILIADDHDALRRGLVRVLTAAGNDVDEAPNGNAAIQRLLLAKEYDATNPALYVMLGDAFLKQNCVSCHDLDDGSGLIRQSPRQKAAAFARHLADKSRGDAFILKSPKELTDVASMLTVKLHSQYVLRYHPTTKIDKVKRDVEIKLTKSPLHEKWRLSVGNVITEATK